VAALRLGAARAIGVDNDPQALSATLDNAARNGIAGSRIAVALPGAPELRGWRGCADLVVANILAGPLLALADTLLELLRPRGTLLLSGLLAGQGPQLCAHYRDRIALQVAAERDGWVCLRGTRG
jgi:ribosomal protein L11 methyltransferase